MLQNFREELHDSHIIKCNMQGTCTCPGLLLPAQHTTPFRQASPGNSTCPRQVIVPVDGYLQENTRHNCLQ